jgi:hypothetical protein
MLFIIAASLLGIGGAFATTVRVDCTTDPQFQDTIGTPVSPGYRCNESQNICTYHKVGNTYTKCKIGTYLSQ